MPSSNNTAEVRAGDTEPLVITVSAVGLTNLDNFTSGQLYARKVGEGANHVDGASIAVFNSALRQVEFDPVGNKAGGGDAFGLTDEGEYDVYVKITFSDADVSRFPGNKEMLRLIVTPTFE